ncbi:MAG TPA: hypothetical protein VGM03_21075 [Phycisphaerae bacterium]|jgi:hypothetical protein
MTSDEFKSLYARSPVQDQAEFLARLANNLTVCGRDAYPLASPAMSADRRVQKFQGVNELQHVIAGQVTALLSQSSERYPDDVLCDALYETAAIYEIVKGFEWAVEQSARALSGASVQP